MQNKRKIIFISILLFAAAALVLLATLNNNNLLSHISRSRDFANINSNADDRITQEQLELKKKYFDLLNDMDNMRYFRDFSSTDEISEEELVLFGYMQALQNKPCLSDDSGHVKRADINSFIKKYFNRTILGKKDTSYFRYIASKDEYVATGWGTDGSHPHYLVNLSNNPNGSITAVFDVYLFHESDMIAGKFPQDYIDNTSAIPAGIEHAKAESTFYLKEEDGTPYLQMISYKRLYDEVDNPNFPADEHFSAVAFSPDEYLSDDELVISGGVRMGMSYEEVMDLLGNYDEAFDNLPGAKSILKNGYHYGFYQIDETFTNQSDLEADGVFRLLNVSLNQFSHDEFPRGIKIGDSIEDVLNKFPGKDKELRKWAHQIIYGKDEIGKPRAFLTFTMFDECYSIYATTTKQVLIIHFDRKNLVRSIDIVKEDS